MFCKLFRPLTLCQYQQTSSSGIIYLLRNLSSKEEAKDKLNKEIEEYKLKMYNFKRPISEKPEYWQSKFKVFGNEEQTSDFISLMQQPIDLSPSALKRWWKNRKEFMERQMQQYIPERHKILGSDLAAAHFIIHRGGSVKFLDRDDWVQADENNEYQLPSKFDPRWKIEAIRCDNMTLYYEGLENIRNLSNLKFWSFVNVKTFDDWCLDRISGAQNTALEVLDLTGTNITYRGLSALYRIDSLKVLVVDDPKISKEFELTCALLEEIIPKLKVYATGNIH